MSRTIFFAALGAMLMYLLGVFSAASFDITTWDSYWRSCCAFLMAMTAAGGVIVANVTKKGQP